MRSTLLGLSALLLSALSFAQTTNLQLGYQEFPTTTLGQVADAQGNLYYTGTFRGELKVNGQVLETGRGLEDIFWVKTDADGRVLRYKTFGSPGSEFSLQDNLVMNADGTMTFFARVTEPVSFGSFTIGPYQTSRGLMPATALVNIDASGTVVWAHKTSLVVSRIYAANNIIHALGQVLMGGGELKTDDRTFLDTTVQTGWVHTMYDLTGRFLNYKTILLKNYGNLTLGKMSAFGNDRLLMPLRVQGDSVIQVNGQDINLSRSGYTYYVYLHTDTSYSSFTYKLLNPGNHLLAFNNVHIPTYATSDSIYAVVCPEYTPSGTYTIDGVPIASKQNTLIVLDNTLTVRRAALLGDSYTSATHPQLTLAKRRVYFRDLFVKGGFLYYSGLYVGGNESPINAIPARDTSLKMLPGVSDTIDLNGGSRSFIARSDLGVTANMLKWYGDHSHYETANLYPLSLRSLGASRFGFVQAMDNVWNPWIIDTDLNILSGSMKRNVDLSETSRLIQFFPDGSRVVMGFARGKTAMDSTDNSLRSNNMRWDAFICRISASGQVLWFRRPYSTLQGADVKKLVVRNNKAYFLINYSNTQNDSNFVRVGSEVYPLAGVQGSLMGSVDLDGNLSVINLKSNVYRNAFLQDFSFFANGDMALMSNHYNPLQVPGYPSGTGFYLFRVNPATAELLDTRKLSTGTFVIPNARRLEIDGQDNIYLYSAATYSSQTSTQILSLYSNTGLVDTLSGAMGSLGQQAAVLKLTWNDLLWMRKSSGGGSISYRAFQDFFLVRNKPVLLLCNTGELPFYWEDQLIHNGSYANKSAVVQLDENGQYIRHKVMGGLTVVNGRKGSGERLYLSGFTQAATQIDTIALGHAGLSDAVGIVVDSLFTAKKSFRLSSPYSENLLDFDVYNDSLAAFAYTAQTNPQLSSARMMAQTSDYEEDAYTGTWVLKTQTTTGINDPLPQGASISIAPNPVTGKRLTLVAQTPEALNTTCYLYGANGQFVASKTIRLSAGASQHEWRLPAGVKPGAYYMILVNKKWRTTRSLIVL